MEDSGTKAESHLKQERIAVESKSDHLRDEAKQKAHQAYDELREGTRKIARESGSYLKKVVAGQQHLLVGKLEEYRDAAKVASDQLKSDEDTVAARNIRKVADGLKCVTRPSWRATSRICEEFRGSLRKVFLQVGGLG